MCLSNSVPLFRCPRLLQGGNVWEKAGVNVSVVYGSMPPEAYRAATGANAAPTGKVGAPFEPLLCIYGSMVCGGMLLEAYRAATGANAPPIGKLHLAPAARCSGGTLAMHAGNGCAAAPGCHMAIV